MGMLYVLDEPSIGLHPMIATLERLRDIGTTVIVVEHDEDTVNEARTVSSYEASTMSLTPAGVLIYFQ